MAQHAIQIPVEKITYVDYYSPDTSYLGQASVKLGGQNYLYEGVYEPGKGIFVRYENDIPVGKKFISARLYLYSIGASANGVGYDSSPHIGINWDDPTWNKKTGKFFNAPTESTNIPTNGWAIFKVYDIRFYKNCSIVANGNVSSLPNFEFNSNGSVDNKPYIEAIYEDVPPSIPALLEPIGLFKDNQSIIRFEWQYRSSVGGVQKAFDLQWSADQVAWNTVNQTTLNNYYDMPANTLPSGNIYWRVQTYNQYDETSGYSAISAFYCIGAPSAPIIQSISVGTARPRVSWASDNQQVYQIQILKDNNIIYDSGNVPSLTEKSYKIKAFLDDGAYTARVRTKNEYDLWSEWGTYKFVISTLKPDKPSFVLDCIDNYIRIDVLPLPGIAYFLIYRAEADTFICIAKTTNSSYLDYSVVSGKEYKYLVRAVTENETYQDGDVKIGVANLRHTLLSVASDPSSTFELIYNLNTPPGKKGIRSKTKAEYFFEGRMYPVFEYSQFQKRDLSCVFFLKKYHEVERFYSMFNAGEIVLYRDSQGRMMYGSLGEISDDNVIGGHIISFNISQTNYSEEIEV